MARRLYDLEEIAENVAKRQELTIKEWEAIKLLRGEYDSRVERSNRVR